jgi:leucyl aminopeptidase
MNYSVEFATGDAESFETELLVILVGKDDDENPLLDDLPELPESPLNDFDAASKETQVFYDGHFEATKLLLLGLGSLEELTPSSVADIVGTVPDIAEEHSVSELTVVYPLFWEVDRAEATKSMVLGLELGGYEFNNFKHEDEEDDDETELEQLKLLLEDRRSSSTVRGGLDRGRSLSDSIAFSRDLANTPANELVPEDLASQARSLAEEYDHLRVNVLEEDELRENDMNLILAVGKGSENPPRLIQLEYDPPESKSTLGLAGKGVTFDTGGISIKPSKKMGEMKFDMCGAAAVLGSLKACADMELPLHVHGLVPTAENMPSDRAVKPGDVVTGYYGKSVEILNTDAEGRLLLADALGYASEELADELDCLIDFATLTGACITSLGHHAAGLMGIDDQICEELQECGQSVEEPVWQLPLWEEYSKELESNVADVKNIGGDAGAITAGAFLREFIDEEALESWAHLDIAGTGWAMPEKSYRPSGGTGFGVQLMDEFLRSHYTF